MCRQPRGYLIPSDPWPALGRLKRKRHLPAEDTSTDVWYLDKLDYYLDRNALLRDLKYPDYYRYYRRVQLKNLVVQELESTPHEE